MSLRPGQARPSRIERQAYRWVMRMLDDPTRHAEPLGRWLAKDPDRRAIYKRVAREVGYASDAAGQLPSLRAAAQPPRPGSSRSYARPLTIAGLTAMLALVVFAGWRYITPGSQPADSMEPPGQVLAIEQGSRTIRLADGSVVTLAGATRARVRFTRGERAIDLEKGIARFVVAHDSARPFVVYARGGKVTALGTVFEVDARREVSVHLLSGRIVVSLPQAAGQKAKPDVVLQPGERISFGAPTAKIPETAPSPRPQPLSRDRRSFDDVPLSQIIAQINLRSPVKVVLAQPSLSERKVFAELDIADADVAARKLATILGLSVDRSVPGQIKLAASN